MPAGRALYMTIQAEAGHVCPMTMTSASVGRWPRAGPANVWLPKIRSRQYDSSNRPFAEKKGVTVGMGMTEKQGGSDVDANTTEAEDDRDGKYRMTGHKWFMSAPMCDAFLVLARARAGSPASSCRDSSRRRVERLQLQRLKDKLGNRSNASAEAEFVAPSRWLSARRARRAHHHRDGEAHPARLRVGLGGLMRMALAQAVHHARHRHAFGGCSSTSR